MHILPESHTSALSYHSETSSLMRQDHEQFANIVKTPENRGFCSWLHTFINKLFGVFGEKLSPGQLNRCLDRIFSEDKGWIKNGDFNIGGVDQTLFREKKSSGINYIVCAPTHDLTEYDSVAAHMAGGRSLIQTFTALTKEYSQGLTKALIPIAQSNSYALFGPRGHFTLLEIDIDDSTIQSAVLHDSKGGFADMFYCGAERLTDIFRKTRLTGDDFFVTVEHRGEQCLLNGNDCGRFAIYYAAQIATEGDLKNASEKSAFAFFKEHFDE